jgi:hypothetical protein
MKVEIYIRHLGRHLIFEGVKSCDTQVLNGGKFLRCVIIQKDGKPYIATARDLMVVEEH